MKIITKTLLLVGILIGAAALNLYLLFEIQQSTAQESFSIIRAGDLKVRAETISGLANSVASGNEFDKKNLENAIAGFEAELTSLEKGGTIGNQQVVAIPSALKEDFDNVVTYWTDYKTKALEVEETSIFDPNSVAALNYVLEKSGDLIILSDGIVSDFDDLGRDYRKHKELATHIQEHVRQISKDALLLSVGEETGIKERFKESRLGIEIDLRKLLQIPTDNLQAFDADHLPESLIAIPRENSDSLNNFEALWEAVQFRILTLEEQALLSPEFQKSRNELDKVKLMLNASIDGLLDLWNDELNKDRSQQQSITQVLIGVDVAVFILVVWVVRQSLSPLELITKGLSKVKEGIYGEKIQYTSEDEVGQLVNTFNIMSDTIKEKEEEAKRTDIAKDEFLAMITHELKTPLVPIQGYADLLLSEHLGKLTQKQRERIKIIKSSSASLLELISDLLDAQKLELGQLKMVKEEHPIMDTICKSVESLKPQADEKKIKITIQGPNPKVIHDQDRIDQVLNNLIKNSLNVVQPKKGMIEIITEDLPDEVKIRIKDNGSGIPPEKQQDLFKKFYQVDATLTREKGGSGLGLAICKGIILGHGGKISLVQSTLGVGTEFEFTIPKIATSGKAPIGIV